MIQFTIAARPKISNRELVLPASPSADVPVTHSQVGWLAHKAPVGTGCKLADEGDFQHTYECFAALHRSSIQVTTADLNPKFIPGLKSGKSGQYLWSVPDPSQASYACT